MGSRFKMRRTRKVQVPLRSIFHWTTPKRQLLDLPTEILMEVFDRCDAKSYVALLSTSKSLREVGMQPAIHNRQVLRKAWLDSFHCLIEPREADYTDSFNMLNKLSDYPEGGNLCNKQWVHFGNILPPWFLSHIDLTLAASRLVRFVESIRHHEKAEYRSWILNILSVLGRVRNDAPTGLLANGCSARVQEIVDAICMDMPFNPIFTNPDQLLPYQLLGKALIMAQVPQIEMLISYNPWIVPFLVPLVRADETPQCEKPQSRAKPALVKKLTQLQLTRITSWSTQNRLGKNPLATPDANTGIIRPLLMQPTIALLSFGQIQLLRLDGIEIPECNPFLLPQTDFVVRDFYLEAVTLDSIINILPLIKRMTSLEVFFFELPATNRNGDGGTILLRHLQRLIDSFRSKLEHFRIDISAVRCLNHFPLPGLDFSNIEVENLSIQYSILDMLLADLFVPQFARPGYKPDRPDPKYYVQPPRSTLTHTSAPAYVQLSHQLGYTLKCPPKPASVFMGRKALENQLEVHSQNMRDLVNDMSQLSLNTCPITSTAWLPPTNLATAPKAFAEDFVLDYLASRIPHGLKTLVVMPSECTIGGIVPLVGLRRAQSYEAFMEAERTAHEFFSPWLWRVIPKGIKIVLHSVDDDIDEGIWSGYGEALPSQPAEFSKVIDERGKRWDEEARQRAENNKRSRAKGILDVDSQCDLILDEDI
ncbi:hypothetical protein BT63DRAFT_465235 [Microthyrium microscopicum]|uniref:F-box domain-containing protein n=1 Tax=Microthyrium microscopicum TaxID=703497 RepID=A0A6A6TYH4_9PEZI|nr:hypothetical protein BT63DRAFT_465235 [Microthyrium microscopicum]